MNCLRSLKTGCDHIALKNDFSYGDRYLNELSLIASQVSARFKMFEDTGRGDGYESKKTQVWILSTEIRSRNGCVQVCNASAVEEQEHF